MKYNSETSLTVNGMPHELWHDRDALTATACRGQYLGDQQKILMDRQLPRETFLRTVLHEALHGIFGTSTLCAGAEKDQELDDVLQEKLCQLLEGALPQLLKDNRWLAEGLME